MDGACACWSRRGVVYQWCGGGARISESGGVDGGEVRAESVRAGERDADVPDGGPCEVAGGRESGVSGASRRAGEVARVPDRARGDRSGADAAGGSEAGSSGAARGRAGRQAASGVRGGRRSGAGCGGVAIWTEWTSAGLHGAVGIGGAGGVAVNAEREIGPERVAEAGSPGDE